MPDAESTRGPLLIVDDDEPVRDVMREVLEERGYLVACASNGQEALRMLQHDPRPRLILLDLMMPVMNGWELLRELRQRAELAGIPVVVLSALGRAGAPSGVPSMAKPLNTEALVRLVEEYAA
jgi:two-component system chemotaxis response regulator CheY